MAANRHAMIRSFTPGASVDEPIDIVDLRI